MLMLACTLTETPKFINVDKIEVKEAKAKYVSIDSDLVFYNPNDLGVKLIKLDIQPYVNNMEMGKVKALKDVEINSKGNFVIPMNFNFNPKAMWQEEKGALIGGIINAFSNKPVTVQYKGSVSVEIAGVAFDLPVDYTTKVVLK